MKAENNGTARAACHKYVECYWGDLIYGTKEQLQAMGLGVGLAFPGEVGGPRCKLNVRDPRGYKVRIDRRDIRDELFTAYLWFPNWPKCPPIYPEWAPPVKGVKKRERIWFDEHSGDAAALAAAGLVCIDQLPGLPGMRKVNVTVYPDGTLPTGRSPDTRTSRLPGARCIQRAGASCYVVQVVLSKDEEVRRRAAADLAEREWRWRVTQLPRPARLQPMGLAVRTGISMAQSAAARDIGFQGVLARLVASATANNRQPKT